MKTEQLAKIFKALGHPTRIKIIEHLNQIDTCICGEIVEMLPQSQSTVSQHLKELKRVGFIQGEIEGPKICYCVDRKTIERAKKLFTTLFSDVCKCC